MRYLTVMFVVALAIGSAGCGSDSDDPEATATSAPAPTATAAQDGEFPAIPAGEITSTAFSPKVRLTLGEGWALPADTAAEFVVEHAVDDAGQQAWIGFFHVNEVRNEDNFTIREPAPANMLSWLSEHKDIIVREAATPLTIGGVQGMQLEVRVDGSYGVPLFDDFETGYDDRFLAVELTVQGERVMVFAGAFDWRRFDDVKPLIDEVLATVRFE